MPRPGIQLNELLGASGNPSDVFANFHERAEERVRLHVQNMFKRLAELCVVIPGCGNEAIRAVLNKDQASLIWRDEFRF